jgi:hypothetical protein
MMPVVGLETACRVCVDVHREGENMRETAHPTNKVEDLKSRTIKVCAECINVAAAEELSRPSEETKQKGFENWFHFN